MNPPLPQHIMIDLGTGNNNKINWAMTDKQEFIDVVETVYRGARKGRGLVVSPKGRMVRGGGQMSSVEIRGSLTQTPYPPNTPCRLLHQVQVLIHPFPSICSPSLYRHPQTSDMLLYPSHSCSGVGL